jgi:isopentenyl-diphosphate delta-isomerase
MWANTTCSHPKKGESYLAGAHRRLQEEMGFDCPLEEQFHFIYKAEFENGLTEYEFDRVFVGQYEGEISPNSEEVNAYTWVNLEALKQDMYMNKSIGKYAEWFKILLEKL